MSVETTTKATNPIVNLNLLDKHIDDCMSVINQEIAKGAKADTSLLIRMIMTVASYMHNNEMALNRTKQKIDSAWIDENHGRFVDLKKNTRTQWLNSATGSVAMAGTIFQTTTLIVAAFTGMPDVGNLLKAPQMIFEGLNKALSGFAGSSQAADQARPLALEHAIQVLQREINESQSQAQNSNGKESESLRQLKELLESEKNHRASFMRSAAAAA